MAIRKFDQYVKDKANDPGYFPGSGLSVDHLKKLLYYMYNNKGTVYEVYVFDYNYRWVTLTRTIIDLVELNRAFVSNYRIQVQSNLSIDEVTFSNFLSDMDPDHYYDEYTQEVIRKKKIIAVARKTGKKYTHIAIISLTKKVKKGPSLYGPPKLTRPAKKGSSLYGPPKLTISDFDPNDYIFDEQFKLTKSQFEAIKQDRIERAQLRHNL